MMKFRILITIVFITVFPFLIKSQSDQVDYISYKFRYIDSNHKIHIESAPFDSAVVKYKFHKEKISKYKDSIAVIAMLELNDWQACNSAIVQLGFTWLRAAYYCWMTVDDVRNLSYSMGYNHPWYFYKAIMNPENNQKEIQNLIQTISEKLIVTKPDIKLDSLTRKQFFMLALKYNPVRLDDLKNLKIYEKDNMNKFKILSN